MTTYDIITSTNESTVVAEYAPDYRMAVEYQSEADLEREFICLLSAQRYEYITFHNKATLINNLRIQLELLNGIVFSDSEWTQNGRLPTAPTMSDIIRLWKRTILKPPADVRGKIS